MRPVSALRQRKRRAGAANQSVLLWGATEIVKPQLSSADLQFLENRKFSRAEICAAFGVPEEIITSTDHAKYDVMQGAASMRNLTQWIALHTENRKPPV